MQRVGRLSDHFHRREFECPCGCGFNTVDAELIRVLQGVRDNYADVVFISSGCRCPKHNRDSDGYPMSMHMIGMAADIRVCGATPDEVYDYLALEYLDRYGIGLYSGHVHIDVRVKKARW